MDSLISLITAFTTLAAMLYVTARIDLQLALVALAVTPPLLLAARHYRPRMRTQSREVKKLESGALSVVQEVLTGLRVVKAFGQEDSEQDRFVGRSGAGMRARIRLRLVEGAYALLVGGIIGAGGGIVLYVGVRGVQQGRITLGELLLVMGYLTQLYAPIKTMARKAGSLQEHLASAERCFALLDEAPEVPEHPAARPLARASGAVEFRAVSFAYGPDRPVLEDVSFTVKPGTRVGIAGATGAGKTTLMSLLTRFYDPLSGQIILDGVDLRDYRLADLRNQLGIVLQEPVLFSTTIFDNIAYARPDATQDEIEAAAAAANIHDFIVALPDGYATQVGERGMGLSGGERQRISLARAFLKDAPILILDEPTSSVDVKTEAVIMEAMERLMSGRTSFMIAHRLSTLDACDLRLEIDDGRIAGRASSQGKPRRRIPARAHENGDHRLSDHPAVRAWLSLGGAQPHAVDVLKSARFRKRGVYRLEEAGPDGSPVIAKICKRKTAEVEAAVYEELLPRLPMPSLRYYGKLLDEDRQHCWLFMEDAGDERYSPERAEHRRLAARWLATIQLHAAEFVRTSYLPDRGPRHYMVHLLNAREEISRHLRREEAADGRRPGPRGPPVEARPGRIALGRVDRLLRHAARDGRARRPGPEEPSHPARRGATSASPSSTGRPQASGCRLRTLRSCWSPSALALARRHRSKRVDRFSAKPCLTTYRSVLRAHGTGAGRRDRRAIRSGGKPVPVPCRHRLDLLGGDERPGIRWMTCVSTRSGLAMPCGWPDGALRGKRSSRRDERRAGRRGARARARAAEMSARGVGGRSVELAGQDQLKTSVHRLWLNIDGGERSRGRQAADPVVARRGWLVARRWLPAVGLQELGPPLLTVAAEQSGEGTWHVYDDLPGRPLSAPEPVDREIEAAIDAIARVHTSFAEHPLLHECRLWGGDRGSQFYSSNVRDAVNTLRSLDSTVVDGRSQRGTRCSSA